MNEKLKGWKVNTVNNPKKKGAIYNIINRLSKIFGII